MDFYISFHFGIGGRYMSDVGNAIYFPYISFGTDLIWLDCDKVREIHNKFEW